MALTLHGYNLSPPVRSTLLTLKALGLDFKEISVSPLAKQHLTEEYLKLNPLHTIPTLEDGDFVIYDSHAINAYLADKYGGGALYPKDLEKRAVINQRLFFDCGTLFPRFLTIIRGYFAGSKTVSKDVVAAIMDGYTSLETLLERSSYVAGEDLSLADFSLITTVTSLNVCVPVASNRYPNITKWMEKMREMPYYAEANQEGLDKLVAAIKVKVS
ncbi:hypothetical protein JTB14_003016 [Gonioctena quinquepunctata]|nr:hypothetical protein JTB14_003016 [Gonioctena quinquepunctata]